MAENNCRDRKDGRGAKGSPSARFIFLKPANDNRANAKATLKRVAFVILLGLLALSAVWANLPQP